MRRRPRPDRYEQSPARLLAVSVGVLVGIVALLVAAAFPRVTLAALVGAGSVPVARRLGRLVEKRRDAASPELASVTGSERHS